MKDKRKSAGKMRSKKYREAFVSATLRHNISAQTLALRKSRGFTQQDMENYGVSQGQMVRVENPDYEYMVSIKTLLSLAAAFDVALAVRFVSFGGMIEWSSDISPDVLEVPSFEDDPQCGNWLQESSTFSAPHAPFREMPTLEPAEAIASLEDKSSTLSAISIQLFSDRNNVSV